MKKIKVKGSIEVKHENRLTISCFDKARCILTKNTKNYSVGDIIEVTGVLGSFGCISAIEAEEIKVLEKSENTLAGKNPKQFSEWFYGQKIEAFNAREIFNKGLA